MVAVFLHLPSHIACTSEEPTFSYVLGCSKHEEFSALTPSVARANFFGFPPLNARGGTSRRLAENSRHRGVGLN